MHLPLTPERLSAVYDMLLAFPPFDRWKLPESMHIKFRVIRSKHKYGDYTGPPHTIRVSASNIGQLGNLEQVIAHELIHLHLRDKGVREWSGHGAQFQKLAHTVCKIHGWDLAHFT